MAFVPTANVTEAEFELSRGQQLWGYDDHGNKDDTVANKYKYSDGQDGSPIYCKMYLKKIKQAYGGHILLSEVSDKRNVV